MTKKKKIIIAVGVVAVAAVGLFALTAGNKGAAALPVPITTATKTELTNSLSVTGVIQSTDSVNIYSDLTYPVKDLNVKVGDQVSAGQTLCTIDSKDLENSIAQKLAAMQTSSAQSKQKIQSSQKKYNETKSNLSGGLNTQVNDASDKVVSAQRTLDTAQKKYNDAKNHVKDNTNSSLLSAQSAVDSAKLNLDNATKVYNDYKKENKDDLDVYEIKTQLHQYWNSVQTSQITYDNAVKSLEALKLTTDESLEQLEKEMNDAKLNYDSAVKAQKTILTSVNQDLISAADSITADKLSADMTSQQKELEALQDKLAKCKVTAPGSGTITAVYAKKNASAGGLLFVLEDTNALKMKVKIKESDIAGVKTGMKAIIKADALKDGKFDGSVQKISPTSLKDKDGETVSSSNAEFETDIVITSKEPGLLIGMNGSADIILEKKTGVYTVPFDAVTQNAKGESIVYAAEQQKDGSFKATAVPVTTGLETDSSVEISGSGIKDGMKIISDGNQVIPGATVKLETEPKGKGGPASGGKTE